MKIQSEKLISEIMAKEAKLDVGQAIRLLLKNKNWKDIVRNVMKKKQSSTEKDAGIMTNLLYSAVILLSTAMGASSAEDLISKIETKANQEQLQQKVPESKLVGKIENLLPFPVSKAELLALKTTNPLVGKPIIDTSLFARQLTKKVQKTMKDIDTVLQKDVNLQGLSSDQIRNLVLKGFKQKLERPQYADAVNVLKKWLGKEKKDMNFVYDIVSDAAQVALK
jgi:hypothetical protein